MVLCSTRCRAYCSDSGICNRLKVHSHGAITIATKPILVSTPPFSEMNWLFQQHHINIPFYVKLSVILFNSLFKYEFKPGFSNRLSLGRDTNNYH